MNTNEYMKEEKQSGVIESESLCPSEEPSKPTFAPIANAMFLNKQKTLNDTMFFVFAPTAYFTYYWTVVKNNIDWYRGFVPGIHNQGILSMQTGARLCDMAAKLTMSGGITFEGAERAEAFLSAFYKARNVQARLSKELPLQNAIGFMLTKVDCNKDGDLDISFVAGNRYFAQCDNRGRVLAFNACIAFVSADVTDNGDNSQSGRNGYYLVEERFYRRGKPCMRYRVYYGAVLATAPTFPNDKGNKGLRREDLPKHVIAMLNRYYIDDLNTIYELPFDEIGAFITPISFSAAGMEDYKCFADGMLANCTTQLYLLDLTETQKNEHKYLAQDFIVMPDTMTVTLSGDRERERQLLTGGGYGGLNKRIAKGAHYSDPTHEAPFLYSPSRQISAYNDDINQLYNEIAAQTDFSPVTIAGYLHNGAEKTATEVTADENATRRTVMSRRELLTNVLNQCNNIIMKHYGITEDGKPLACATVFRAGAMSNPKLETDLIVTKLQNHLITRQMAVEEANPQLSKRDAQKVYEQAAEEMKEEQSQPFGGLDGFDVGV